MTEFPDLFGALAAPFGAEEVKARNVPGGKTIEYITARQAMNRLDNVLGPENWYDEYLLNEHSVVCRLTIRLPNGSLLTKQDCGGYANMADSGDNVKSGVSGSFKRAAVKFGIGREFYGDGVPGYVNEGPPHDHARPAQQPAQSRPAQTQQQSRQAPAAAKGPSDEEATGNPPRTGRALFAWSKDLEGKYEGLQLIGPINDLGKKHNWPQRMVDWDGTQVSQGHAHACGVIEEYRTF